MRGDRSRRNFLACAAATAATGIVAMPPAAVSQKGSATMATSSDLDYRTATELVDLLATRKVSAVELLQRDRKSTRLNSSHRV
jgi:hypothetical protein